MGKNYLCYGKGISTNFPGSPHWKGFVTFSHTMRNWWGNPCISHMMKYTIGWKSNGKKAPIPWDKYEYQFPRISRYHGFCCIFPYHGKFMGKLIHFPYVEVYHRIGIRCEKTTHPMGEVWVSVSQTFPIPWVLLQCTVGNFCGNPYISHMMISVNCFLWYTLSSQLF